MQPITSVSTVEIKAMINELTKARPNFNVAAKSQMAPAHTRG